MTDNSIQFKRDNVLKLKLKNEMGEDTGEYLEFDLEDIELPLRYQRALEEHKKNYNSLKNQLLIISKKEDHSGKKLLSSNQEASLIALSEFYKKEIKIMDLFLGEGKTQMILDKVMRRKPYLTMFNDIMESIEEVSDLFNLGYSSIEDKIKEKYSKVEDNILEQS